MFQKTGILLLVLACSAGCASARLGESSRNLGAPGVFDKKPAGYYCTLDRDCTSGHCLDFTCVEGNMGNKCANDGDCYADKCADHKCWCDTGMCRAKLRRDAPCTRYDNSQCASGNCMVIAKMSENAQARLRKSPYLQRSFEENGIYGMVCAPKMCLHYSYYAKYGMANTGATEAQKRAMLPWFKKFC